MGKCLITVILFIISYSSGYSQIILEIHELYISNYNLGKNYKPLEEDHWGGPKVGANCILKNMSCDPVQFNPSIDSVELNFRLASKEYSEILTVYFNGGNNNISLKKGESQLFGFSTEILLGTDIYKQDSTDYRDILLQIIPTLKIRYKLNEKEKEIVSNGINSVRLIVSE